MAEAREREGAWGRARALALRHPALVAAAVAALAFLNTLPNEPVLDDGWAVLENPVVRTLDVPRALGAQYGHAGGSTLQGPYRPLATLSWALQYALHGRAPLGYHLVNVLLHALATALVVLLARRLVAAANAAARREGPRRAGVGPRELCSRGGAARPVVIAGALGAGLLFALHPAHVEAVAPIVARTDLLAGAGGLAALLLALGPRSPARLAGAFAALLAAMLSKETAAAIPLLYLLVAALLPAAAGLEARPGLGSAGARRALAAAAVAALVLSAAVAAYLALRPGAAVAPVDSRWFGARPTSVVLFTMTRALAEYLHVLAFPWSLSSDFGYAARIPFTQRFGAEAAMATAIWAAVLAAGLASARRAPLLSLAVLWTFAALLPVLNLVPIGVLMAERLLYLPSVGLCVLAGQLPAAIAERAGAARWRAAPGWAAAAVLLALGGRTLARNADWRTPLSLWQAEVRAAPRDPVVNNNLAVELTAHGEPRRALERLDVALAVAPGYWRAWVNRGIALHRLGDLEGALASFGRASAIAPREASPFYFAGWALAERGDCERALAAFARAEGLEPEDPRTVLASAACLARLGRVGEAREKLRRAAALDPQDPEPARRLAALDGAR
jgi:protein O-mannosyl-transferase